MLSNVRRTGERCASRRSLREAGNLGGHVRMQPLLAEVAHICLPAPLVSTYDGISLLRYRLSKETVSLY